MSLAPYGVQKSSVGIERGSTSSLFPFLVHGPEKTSTKRRVVARNMGRLRRCLLEALPTVAPGLFGVSVLLRQARGCEGVSVIHEVLDAEDPAFPHGVDGGSLQCKSRAVACATPDEPRHDPVAGVDEVGGGFCGVGVPSLCGVARAGARPPLDPRKAPTPANPPGSARSRRDRASHEGHPHPQHSTPRRQPAQLRRSPATSPAQYPAGSRIERVSHLYQCLIWAAGTASGGRRPTRGRASSGAASAAASPRPSPR